MKCTILAIDAAAATGWAVGSAGPQVWGTEHFTATDRAARWRACLEAGVELQTVEYEGDDPRAFVISANIHRRHLTIGQRAMLAAERANVAHGGDRRLDQVANSPLEDQPVSQADAAKQFNVGERRMREAQKVLDEASPETVGAVKGGDMMVSPSRLP